jgi:uncharacterized membrane protein YqiK
MEPDLALFVAAGFAVVVLGAGLVWWWRVRVGSDQAAIVHVIGRPPRVVFSDVVVVPMFGHAELVDLKALTIELDHRGGEGLHCHDAIKAALTVRFTVRVGRAPEDVMMAAAQVGAERVTDPDTLHRLFAGKFAEAVACVVCQMEFQQLLLDRQRISEQISVVVGSDLAGWTLEEVAIARIEQVPIEMLDANDLLGARAILRITEETSRDRVRVAEIEARARLEEHHIASSTAH